MSDSETKQVENVELVIQIPLEEYERLKCIRDNFNMLVNRYTEEIEYRYMSRIKSLEAKLYDER